MSHIDTDICVAGGGPAGLAAACAIVRATDYSVKVHGNAICKAYTTTTALQYMPSGNERGIPPHWSSAEKDVGCLPGLRGSLGLQAAGSWGAGEPEWSACPGGNRPGAVQEVRAPGPCRSHALMLLHVMHAQWAPLHHAGCRPSRCQSWAPSASARTGSLSSSDQPCSLARRCGKSELSASFNCQHSCSHCCYPK